MMSHHSGSAFCNILLSDISNVEWKRALANLGPQSHRVSIEATLAEQHHGGLIAIDDIRWEFEAVCKGTWENSEY